MDVDGMLAAGETERAERTLTEACGLICDMFRHSPVYRLGEDQFTVIMRNRDLRDKDRLLEQLQAAVDENRKQGGAALATGIAHFDPAVDASLQSVVERANIAMYENRLELARK